MLVAVAAAALVSCSKDDGTTGGDETPMIELTLRAGNPEVAATAVEGTRTEMQGTIPYWTVGDQIGVSTTADGTTYTNEAFTNDNTTGPSTTTTFSGKVAVSATIYTYYPYTSNNIGSAGSHTGAKIDIPVNQNPTATSFDGKADILVGKPLTMPAAGQQIENLQFARVGGIVKVVLKDNSTGKLLTDQHVASLSITTDGANTLAGRVVLDIVNGVLYEPYYNASNIVTASYTAETQYAIDGTNGSYLGVFPRTLPAASTLTVTATTEGYAISKAITLAQAIEILAGKVTTLNITLADANITASATGMVLPFVDNFSWIKTTSTSALALKDYPVNADGDPLYTATANTYPETPALKLGKSGGTDENRGYFTTTELDLSQAFTVFVRAKAYGADNSSLQITAGETVKTAAMTADYKYYAFEFEPQSAKAKVEVKVTGNRGHIVDFQVLNGHDLTLPTVLSITSGTPVSVPAAGEVVTATYSVENPIDGTTISASAGDASAWITDFDYTTPGAVSFIVAENTAAEARTGTVTLTYGALSQSIEINQAAKNSGDVGANWTYSFVKGDEGIVAGTGVTSDGVTWKASLKPTGFDANNGVRGLSWSKPANVTLATSTYTGKIKSMTLIMSANAVGSQMTITVGGQPLGSMTELTKDNNIQYTFESETALEGEIVLTLNSTGSAKSLMIKTITIN